VSTVEVHNRDDCCKDRAVPLVVEASTDHSSWSELGRKTSDFEAWTLTFSRREVRYLRLTVPRRTMLHLKSVHVR
jgi:hypothetical protein